MDIELNGDIAIVSIHRKDGEIVKTLIDAEDIHKIRGYNLYSRKEKNGYYIIAEKWENAEKVRIPIHRLIVNSDCNSVIDHINKHPEDNRKSNLRILNKAENAQNRRGANSNNKTGIRGVSFNKKLKKYSAQVFYNYKSIYLGLYKTKEEAEKVVKKKRKELMKYDN